MKNNVLFLADLHAHAYKNQSRVIDGVNSRLLDLRSVFVEALECGKNNDCGYLVIAGDVFHVRGNLRPSTLNFVNRLIIMAVESYGMTVKILAGNHDYENYGAIDTAIDIFDNIESHDTEEVYEIDGGVDTIVRARKIGFAGKQFGFIPYCHDVDEFKETYKRVVKTKMDVIVIHQGIDEFSPDESIPRTTITEKFLTEGYDGFVFAGHYHAPRKSKCGKIISIGSPYHLTFGDSGPRACWIYKPDDSIVEYHELSSAPKFITIEYDNGDTPTFTDGDYVRVKAKTTKGLKEYVKTLEERAGSVTVHLEKEYSSAHEKVIKLGTPVQMLSDYIDIQEKYQSHKDKIIKLFNNICLE